MLKQHNVKREQIKPEEQVTVLVCGCHVPTATEEQAGVVGGDRVEIDKSSCDRNEECSVLKGLTSTPEVCFHSLIRHERSQCSSKQTNQWVHPVPHYWKQRAGRRDFEWSGNQISIIFLFFFFFLNYKFVDLEIIRFSAVTLPWSTLSCKFNFSVKEFQTSLVEKTHTHKNLTLFISPSS